MQVNLCRAPDLGTGPSLYFQTVRSISICMIVMTLLAEPTLVFAWFGKRMPEEDYDSLGLYRFTLGTIGYNRNSPTYVEDSKCQNEYSFMSVNDTCVHLSFPQKVVEIPLSAVGTIITLTEMLQIFAFFITIVHIRRRAAYIEKELSCMVTSITDYAVMVRNIPPDTTMEELITHFSDLYPLDKPDWRKRPTLVGARPVQHVSSHKVFVRRIV